MSLSPSVTMPATKDLDVTIAVHDRRWHDSLPSAPALCERIIRLVLARQAMRWRMPQDDRTLEVACVLTGDQEIQNLNARFRSRDKPTNVLSFIADPDAPSDAAMPRVLGDIIISLDTLKREATEQGKSLHDHTAHMLVHGMLHLLGYDHEQGEEAASEMERQEIELLQELGIANPYQLKN